MSDAYKKVKRMLESEIRKRTSHVFPTVINKKAPRYNELHPSSYPYCGLRQAYSEVADLPPKKFDFYGEYYTGVGTTTHELLQRYMGYKGKVIGFWKCRKCFVSTTSTKPKVAPDKCSQCKHDVFEYLEAPIAYKKYTRGHIDGIIKIDGKYYIIDYKTTSKEKNEKHRQFKNVYPYKYNVSQIESYVYYFEKQYGIKISGWFLIYVNRDNCTKDFIVEGKLMSSSDKETLGKKLKIYEKQFSYVMKMRKKVKDEYWKYLIKTKPCSSMAQYKKDMHCYDMCPLAEKGICFNESRLKREIKNLTSKVKLVEEL